THFDDRAIEALRRYPWPGNIRELENAIERSVVMAEEAEITLRDLPATILAGPAHPVRVLETKPVGASNVPADAPAAEPTGNERRAAAEFARERQTLLEALARSNGNKAEAARLLGIPRSTLFSRLKKFGLE